MVDDLHRKFADFHRVYAEDGLAVEEFDSFPATQRTLRQFIAACHDIESLVRDFICPIPIWLEGRRLRSMVNLALMKTALAVLSNATIKVRANRALSNSVSQIFEKRFP